MITVEFFLKSRRVFPLSRLNLQSLIFFLIIAWGFSAEALQQDPDYKIKGADALVINKSPNERLQNQFESLLKEAGYDVKNEHWRIVRQQSFYRNLTFNKHYQEVLAEAIPLADLTIAISETQNIQAYSSFKKILYEGKGAGLSESDCQQILDTIKENWFKDVQNGPKYRYLFFGFNEREVPANCKKYDDYYELLSYEKRDFTKMGRWILCKGDIVVVFNEKNVFFKYWIAGSFILTIVIVLIGLVWRRVRGNMIK